MAICRKKWTSKFSKISHFYRETTRSSIWVKSLDLIIEIVDFWALSGSNRILDSGIFYRVVTTGRYSDCTTVSCGQKNQMDTEGITIVWIISHYDRAFQIHLGKTFLLKWFPSDAQRTLEPSGLLWSPNEPAGYSPFKCPGNEQIKKLNCFPFSTWRFHETLTFRCIYRSLWSDLAIRPAIRN